MNIDFEKIDKHELITSVFHDILIADDAISFRNIVKRDKTKQMLEFYITHIIYYRASNCLIYILTIYENIDSIELLRKLFLSNGSILELYVPNMLNRTYDIVNYLCDKSNSYKYVKLSDECTNFFNSNFDYDNDLINLLKSLGFDFSKKVHKDKLTWDNLQTTQMNNVLGSYLIKFTKKIYITTYLNTIVCCA